MLYWFVLSCVFVGLPMLCWCVLFGFVWFVSFRFVCVRFVSFCVVLSCYIVCVVPFVFVYAKFQHQHYVTRMRAHVSWYRKQTYEPVSWCRKWAYALVSRDRKWADTESRIVLLINILNAFDADVFFNCVSLLLMLLRSSLLWMLILWLALIQP